MTCFLSIDVLYKDFGGSVEGGDAVLADAGFAFEFWGDKVYESGGDFYVVTPAGGVGAGHASVVAFTEWADFLFR